MISSLLTYCVNKLIFINIADGWVEVFCRSHLNDLISPLFVLGFAQIMFLWAGCEVKTYIVFIAFGMSCGCVWEYIAPVINPIAISDPWDLLCYFIGINIYYLVYVIQVNAGKKINQKAP